MTMKTTKKIINAIVYTTLAALLQLCAYLRW